MSLVDRCHRTQLGFTFVEVFAAIAVAGIVALGASSLFHSMSQTQVKADRLFWITARKMEFQNIIRSDTGWAQVLANNPNMACLANSNLSCAAFTAPQPLRLPMDGSILDGAHPGLGMNNNGDFCYDFDPVNGSRQCPIGIQARWLALCDNVQCRHPQPKMTFEFTLNDAAENAHQVMSGNNRLIVFRSQTLETLNDVCTAMGGVLVSGICTMPQLATACDPANGSFTLGFDTQGTVVCGKPNPGSCGIGDFAYGFSANGTILCTN